MPSIEEEIANWLNQRPNWIHVLAAEILRTGDVDDAFARALANDLISKKPIASPKKLTATDLPTSTSTGARVELASISALQNVNALADDGALTFGDAGLTGARTERDAFRFQHSVHSAEARAELRGDGLDR